MKTKKLLFLAVLNLFIFSCKNEKKTELVESKKVQNGFTITFDLIAKQNDNFHLYYTEDNSINFNEKKSVWMPITGNENMQQVTFKLSEDAIPTNLRVDFGFGKNEKQTEILLKKFQMNYYDKSFEAENSKIFNYFYINNQNTLLDINTATIKRLKIDQVTAPSIYPHIPLTEELNKMIKN